MEQLVMPETPELEKVQKVKEQSQKIGEFLEWLQQEQGVVFARWDLNHQHTDDCCAENGVHICGRYRGDDALLPAPLVTEQILAEFFGIDLKKCEQEKVALLEAVRAAGGRHAA